MKLIVRNSERRGASGRIYAGGRYLGACSWATDAAACAAVYAFASEGGDVEFERRFEVETWGGDTVDVYALDAKGALDEYVSLRDGRCDAYTITGPDGRAIGVEVVPFVGPVLAEAVPA